MNGLVSDIQRFSVNDGYGIRTIVFLAGCTMRCAWCQNPETLAGKPELMFNEQLCTGCGACLTVCPTGAAIRKDGRILVDREKCQACFECVDACQFDARKPSCKLMTVKQVYDEVMRDEVFYRNSGGGLTLSGGEPLYQVEFATELLAKVKKAGIHTAIETAANVPYELFEKVLPYTDLFLFDLKIFDEEKHLKWTKVSNTDVLRNLARLSTTGKEIIIRVPLIPGVNDGDEFRSIVEYVKLFPSISELHILPYHSLGESKYAQLEMNNAMLGYREDNEEQVEICKNYAKEQGLKVSVGGAGF